MNLPGLSVRHLLGIASLPSEDILTIFAAADRMKADFLSTRTDGDELTGKRIVNLFIEDSTRTRNSFHLAQIRLGALPLHVVGGGSSLSKGETLLDTVRVIEAMGVDAFVLRHSAACAPHFLQDHTDAVLINAGDGRHEHPTQALLDGYTMYCHWREDLAAGERPFAGRKVAIVGDITHGRVALSNIFALTRLGADVTLCGPPTLIPKGIERLGVTVARRLDDALDAADAVIMLRMQLERQSQSFVPSLGEYRRLYGLDRSKRSLLKSDALVLHPGPINRGVELDSEIADSTHSVVLEQVGNGVAVRMAVLSLLLRDRPNNGNGKSRGAADHPIEQSTTHAHRTRSN